MAANTNQAASNSKQKRGGKKSNKSRGAEMTNAQRRKANLAPPADFGARLFTSLKADMSSEETGCRRRRAYTEMDDLLADDIKQGEHATSVR